MLENSSDERVTEVLRRLLSIQDVIAPEHFDALTWTLMKAIGAEAMAEAERRSFILHEPPPRPPRCAVIPFPTDHQGTRRHPRRGRKPRTGQPDRPDRNGDQ
ncbi:hypothetical protein ASF60_05185 [Methylobacterium sp. Leaf113]|uniref:hypothetical protein n=1 Tax=Methylobacterium sp. Leaf113 TaxID=1736259 RepID=UPI0006F7EF20|nr:hypothetical protein [Methylobacterium sp. Leaf113]KQP85494.1 hypothetical protein ASF60_05185 [Methylobacterium sp. Leaf113]